MSKMSLKNYLEEKDLIYSEKLTCMEKVMVLIAKIAAFQLSFFANNAAKQISSIQNLVSMIN